jgi:hypothetical protein
VHHGLPGLFDVCTNLSTLKYEGKEGIGRIVFARRQHPHIRVDLALRTPVRLRSFGAVRKLLQVGSGHLALLCDSHEVYGLGKVLPTYDLAAEAVFTIQFTKQFVWDLLHAGNRLMHVRYGQPSSSVPGFREEKLRADLPRFFPGIRNQALDRFCGLARSAAGQEHGCMLVISSAAAAEAERLDSQCTRVEPFPLTETVMPLVTAIDGSVLVDTEGKCHAIGVILDGVASPKCSPGRVRGRTPRSATSSAGGMRWRWSSRKTVWSASSRTCDRKSGDPKSSASLPSCARWRAGPPLRSKTFTR